MRDRIPPRVDTPIYVDVSPNLAGSGQYVTFDVINQDMYHGTVTINGIDTARITSSGDIALRGVTQTEGGTAGEADFSGAECRVVAGRVAGPWAGHDPERRLQRCGNPDQPDQ